MKIRTDISSDHKVYHIENGKYTVISPKTYDWEDFRVMIPDIADPSKLTPIYTARTLEILKNFLGSFNSEDELLLEYVKARFEGYDNLNQSRKPSRV